VSFEVKRGEVVGIIGRNGAGKSTLLKILSRITEPTEGRAEIHGRVGSLLEVGTGFHPELTGRENIHLSGALLGMRRAEIDRRFDEIVDFSGVETFVDTPVKRYSSGMRVRLGFAVAAHLEPEILLVDEVLAVGDAAFQRKCLSKMGEVADVGRTVVLVSHDMTAIQSLCHHSLLIDQGRLALAGSPTETVQQYLRAQATSQSARFGSHTARRGTGRAFYQRAALLDSGGRAASAIGVGEGFVVELEFESEGIIVDPSFGVVIRSELGQRVAQLITRITHGAMPDAIKGGLVRLQVDRLEVVPGRYYLSLGLSMKKEQLDYIENALELEVTPRDVYQTGKLPSLGSSIMCIPCRWSHEYE
jgi:lipopolysaccharide transport system ATP-binding protein